MNYKKLFGFGILIWAVAFLVATAFVAYEAADTLWAKAIVILAVAVIAFFAGKTLKSVSAMDALKYSTSWVAIGLILDMIVTVRFTGWEVFSAWDLWVGYALVFILPLLTVQKSAPIAA